MDEEYNEYMEQHNNTSTSISEKYSEDDVCDTNFHEVNKQDHPYVGAALALETDINKQLAKRKTKEDYELLGILGEGSFSSVFLCKEKGTEKKYAMKLLDKKQIVKENKVKYVHSEKHILTKLEHPFIVKFYCTFQDAFCLCKSTSTCNRYFEKRDSLLCCRFYFRVC